jgi:hypothetical protein
MQKLRESYDKRQEKTSLFTWELLKVIDMLQKNNIRFFILKGIPLAIKIYDEATLRSFSDIDIFIHKVDMEQATQLISDIGYKPMQVTNINMIGHHHRVLINDKKDIVIELHHKLIKDQFFISSNKPSSMLYFENLWNNRQEIYFFSRKIYSFTIEDELLYLIYHATTHYFLYLKWLGDIYELICMNRNINWNSLVIKAQYSGLIKPLVQALVLCSVYFQLDLNSIPFNYSGSILNTVLKSARIRKMTNIISQLITYNYRYYFNLKRSLSFSVKVIIYRSFLKAFFSRKTQLISLLYYEARENLYIARNKIQKNRD